MMRPSTVFLATWLSLVFPTLAQQSSVPSTLEGTKPRVYVTDSDSWQMEGSAGGANGAFAAHTSGGARPQTAEIIKTFGERCPSVIVNSRLDASDYVVRLDHEGGKGLLRKDNKVAVFAKKSGDSIFSKSTLSLGGSVQDACAAIATHWQSHAKELAEIAVPATGGASAAITASTVDKPKISVSSTPPGADIEINGAFVGNTPSILEVDPGKNEIKISKSGFTPWTRTLMVKGGTISVSAELEASTR